jgi:hypothetical protein
MARMDVRGTVPHGERDTAEFPIVIGGQASSSTPVAVDNAQKVRAYFDEYGYLHVVVGAGSAAIGTVKLDEYGTNDIAEPSATITYVGKEKGDGSWLLMKIDTSSGTVIRYASIVNNATVTSYAAAWTARATTNVYGTYSEAI